MLNGIEVYKEIMYFPGAIKNVDYLIELIKTTSNDIVSDWKTWGGHNDEENPPYGIRKSVNGELTSKDSEDQKTKYIIDTIYNALFDVAESYKDRYNIEDPIFINKDFVVNEYIDGGFMGPHVDYNEYNPKLLKSFVVYLNDNYEGGEIYFNEQDVKVKPEAGSVIIFPSTEPFFHSSLINYNGKKMFIPHFWTKKEFQDDSRKTT